MNSKQDKLPQEAIVTEYRNGQTVQEIALLFGVSRATIKKILSKNGVEVKRGRPKHDPKTHKRFRSYNVGKSRYEMRLQGKGWDDIAKIFNVSRQAVFVSAKIYAKEEGKEWPPIKAKVGKDTTAIDKRAYHLHAEGDPRKTWSDIANIIKRSPFFVRSAAKRYAEKNGLPFPMITGRKTKTQQDRNHENNIRKSMYESGMSLAEISMERGVTHMAVYFSLKRNGVTMRKAARRPTKTNDGSVKP